MSVFYIVTLAVLLGLIISAGCSNGGDDYLIVPGIRVGKIRSDTSEADLAKLFGAGLVKPAEIPMGEGETEPGTIILAPDSLSTLGIIWKDREHRNNPLEIRWQGTKCRWETAEGVTLGITLKELEAANGRPFQLLGFGWDYAGTFMRSNGGKLAYLDREHTSSNRPSAGEILVRMQPPNGATGASPDSDYFAVSGDREFSSGHPAMQKLNPSVYEMIFFFP